MHSTDFWVICQAVWPGNDVTNVIKRLAASVLYNEPQHTASLGRVGESVSSLLPLRSVRRTLQAAGRPGGLSLLLSRDGAFTLHYKFHGYNMVHMVSLDERHVLAMGAARRLQQQLEARLMPATATNLGIAPPTTGVYVPPAVPALPPPAAAPYHHQSQPQLQLPWREDNRPRAAGNGTGVVIQQLSDPCSSNSNNSGGNSDNSGSSHSSDDVESLGDDDQHQQRQLQLAPPRPQQRLQLQRQQHPQQQQRQRAQQQQAQKQPPRAKPVTCELQLHQLQDGAYAAVLAPHDPSAVLQPGSRNNSRNSTGQVAAGRRKLTWTRGIDDSGGGGGAAADDMRSLLELLPQDKQLLRALAPYTQPSSDPYLVDLVVDVGRPVSLRLPDKSCVQLGVTVDLDAALVKLQQAFGGNGSGSNGQATAGDQQRTARGRGRKPPARSNRAASAAAAAAAGGAGARLAPIFSDINRLGVPGSLHRISAMRDRAGAVYGLTYRVGRHVPGVAGLLADVLSSLRDAGRGISRSSSSSRSTRGARGSSSSSFSSVVPSMARQAKGLLLLGRPGVGKTVALRDIARLLSVPEEEGGLGMSVVVVDSSNEIAGDSDQPHPCIGRARRMMVPSRDQQATVMMEAVINHTPEVIIVDEIATKEEAAACRAIAARGVLLVSTAHGGSLADLLRNPDLQGLVGGVKPVTLGDRTAADTNRGQKTRLERAGAVTFGSLVEILDTNKWRLHPDVAQSVDLLLASSYSSSSSHHDQDLDIPSTTPPGADTQLRSRVGNTSSASFFGPSSFACLGPSSGRGMAGQQQQGCGGSSGSGSDAAQQQGVYLVTFESGKVPPTAAWADEWDGPLLERSRRSPGRAQQGPGGLPRSCNARSSSDARMQQWQANRLRLQWRRQPEQEPEGSEVSEEEAEESGDLEEEAEGLEGSEEGDEGLEGSEGEEGAEEGVEESAEEVEEPRGVRQQPRRQGRQQQQQQWRQQPKRQTRQLRQQPKQQQQRVGAKRGRDQGQQQQKDTQQQDQRAPKRARRGSTGAQQHQQQQVPPPGSPVKTRRQKQQQQQQNRTVGTRRSTRGGRK